MFMFSERMIAMLMIAEANCVQREAVTGYDDVLLPSNWRSYKCDIEMANVGAASLITLR